MKHIESNEDVYFNYGIRKSIQIALVQFIEKEKEQSGLDFVYPNGASLNV